MKEALKIIYADAELYNQGVKYNILYKLNWKFNIRLFFL